MPIFGQIRMKTANFTPDLGGSPGTGKHRQRFPPQRSLIQAVLSTTRETREHSCASRALPYEVSNEHQYFNGT